MAVTIGKGGAMTVGTPSQIAGLKKKSVITKYSAGGGGGNEGMSIASPEEIAKSMAKIEENARQQEQARQEQIKKQEQEIQLQAKKNIELIRQQRIKGQINQQAFKKQLELSNAVKNLSFLKGRGYSRIETQRLLGGGQGISSLRTAKRIFPEQQLKLIQEKQITKNDIFNLREYLQNQINLQAQSKMSVRKPINLYSLDTWKRFGEDLKNSKSEKNRNLGQKILINPLLFSSKFVSQTVESSKNIPLGLLDLTKNPKNIKNLPENIKADIKDTLNLLKTSPSEGVGKIGSDIFTFKLVGGSLKFTGKVASQGINKINPYFKNFDKNVIKIKAPEQIFIRRGKEIFLKKRIKNTTIINKIKGKIKSKIESPKLREFIKVRKKGQFKKFQQKRGIVLRKGLLTENARSLSKQTKLAGQRGTIVTAQADKLISFFNRNRIIRKPIPNEVNFSKKTKNLLNKFDEGKISKKGFYNLNKRVLKESGKTLLERSLFADPKGLVRFTRLGQGVGEASVKDILRGNFTFKKTKPQIIVFPEGKIQKFPRSLKKIVNKLKSNKILNEKERSKLVNFQTTPSGKWKPIGDIRYRGGRELEVTLSPGETIRRVKKLAKTEINGIPIDIVEAKIIKLKQPTIKLLNKAKIGKINKSETKKLRKLLSKQTNLKVGSREIQNLNKKLSRRTFGQKKYLPIKKRIFTGLIKKIKRPTPRPGKRIPGSLRPRPTPRPGKRIPGSLRPRPTLNRQIKIPAFNVFAKSGKRFYKLNRKPLSRENALSKGTYAIDNTTSKQFKIIPINTSKKNIGKLKSIERNYFNRAGYKLREFKIKRGRKFGIKPKYIEKTRYGIDSYGEKKGLSILRYLKNQSFRRPKRKISSTQRNILVKRLQKARNIRMANIKKRR